MTPFRALSPLAFLLAVALTPAVAGNLPAEAARPATVAAAAHQRADADRVAVGSYNIRADRSTKEFKRAVAALRQHVGVAGLQEVNTGRKTRVLKRMKGWRSYRPEQLQQNPVIWRKDELDRIKGRGVKIARARSIGHEGVPHHRHAQFATIVRLQHVATGRRLSVINTHLVTGAVNGGRCIKDHPRLCELYQESVAGLARAVAREQEWADGEVFVLGDFNDNYPADRARHKKTLAYARLTDLQLVAHWEKRKELPPHQGSRGGAYLDQIWAADLPRSISVLRSIKASDHYPITATYAIAPPPTT